MAGRMTPLGAVERYLAENLFGAYSHRERRVTLSTTVQEVVGNNPERIALILINLGSVRITLGMDQQVTDANGIILPDTGSGVAMVVPEDAVLPAFSWFAVAQTGTPDIYVLEVIRDYGE